MIGLTLKQRQLYDFIVSYTADWKMPPTIAEMAIGIDLKSKSSVARLLTTLERRGHIRRLPNLARAIELVHPAPTVTLNAEILTLTDRYAAEHKISRDTAANELIRSALEAA